MVCVAQIFKPGGFTGVAGTPNFLLDLGPAIVGVNWTDSQIGGVQTATFKLKQQYETVLDIVAGDWIILGLQGGTTPTTYGSGTSTIQVLNATDDLGHPYFANGDSIVISDGVNSEIFTAATVSYSSSIATITLGAAPSQNTSHLLNTMAGGARVAQLKFQGLITGRQRTTEWNLNFSVIATGMLWRYQKVIANTTLVQEDSAIAILNICQAVASQVPEIIVNSANFASANSIVFSSNAKSQTVMTLFSQILQNEAGGAVPSTPNEASFWAMWVDELRQVHHARIPTLNFASATYVVDLVANNTYGDVLGPLQTTDMDMTRLLNVALVQGGTDSSGNSASIVLTHQPSYQDFGFYEGILTNTNLTDAQSLAFWAAGQMGVLAWPQSTGRLALVVASTRLTCRDLLQVTGFTDSSTLVTNPTEIRYALDSFEKPVVTAMITLTQQQPNFQSVMAEIAGQTSIRALQNASYSDVAQTYIVSGLVISTSGLSYTVSAGVVVYNGVAFSVPASSGSMSNGDSIVLGAQVLGTSPGPTLPAVVLMPNFVGNTRISAQNWFQLQGSSGNLTLAQMTNFQGLYLGLLTAMSGQITVELSQRSQGGINSSRVIFQGMSTDQATGSQYFSDGNLYASTTPYTLPFGGPNCAIEVDVGLTLSSAGGTAAPCIWLFVNAPVASYQGNPTGGYMLGWNTAADGTFRMYRFNGSSFIQLGQSPNSYSEDTNQHLISVIAKCPQNGGPFFFTVLMDGAVVLSCSDTGVFYSSGFVGIQNRGSATKILINPVATDVDIGGAIGTSANTSQVSAYPIQVPPVNFSGNTSLGNCSFGFVGSNVVVFPDGSTVLASTSGGHFAIGAGTYYFMIAYNIATAFMMLYLSTSPPTPAQQAPFIGDGIVSIILNGSLTLSGGFSYTTTVNYGGRQL